MAIICMTMTGANNKKAKKNKAPSDCDKATCCMLCASLPFNMNSTLLGPAPHVHPDNLKQAAMKHPFSTAVTSAFSEWFRQLCPVVLTGLLNCLDFHLRQSERFTNDCVMLSRSSLEKKGTSKRVIALHSASLQ